MLLERSTGRTRRNKGWRRTNLSADGRADPEEADGSGRSQPAEDCPLPLSSRTEPYELGRRASGSVDWEMFGFPVRPAGWVDYLGCLGEGRPPVTGGRGSVIDAVVRCVTPLPES